VWFLSLAGAVQLAEGQVKVDFMARGGQVGGQAGSCPMAVRGGVFRWDLLCGLRTRPSWGSSNELGSHGYHSAAASLALSWDRLAVSDAGGHTWWILGLNCEAMEHPLVWSGSVLIF